MAEIILKLPDTVLATLGKIALQEDMTPSQIIRNAIDRDLYRRRRAKRADWTDERSVASLRALLGKAFDQAASWPELQGRLAAKGYELRTSGGSVAVHELGSGAWVCKASDLGQAYATLVRRLRTGFPGRPERSAARGLPG